MFAMHVQDCMYRHIRIDEHRAIRYTYAWAIDGCRAGQIACMDWVHVVCILLKPIIKHSLDH